MNENLQHLEVNPKKTQSSKGGAHVERNKRVGLAQERLTAKMLGVDVTPGSGNGYTKGDMHVPPFCIQHKYTRLTSFRCTVKVVTAAINDAVKHDLLPALVIVIAGNPHVVLIPVVDVLTPFIDLSNFNKISKNVLTDASYHVLISFKKLEYCSDWITLTLTEFYEIVCKMKK